MGVRFFDHLVQYNDVLWYNKLLASYFSISPALALDITRHLITSTFGEISFGMH